MLELLIADLKAAVRQRVNDVVGHPGVLGYRQHVIPRAGGRIPHQEHAMPLPLQPSLRLRPRHWTHVPAGAVRRIEPGGGGHGSERGRAREGRKKAKSPEAPREEESREGKARKGRRRGRGRGGSAQPGGRAAKGRGMRRRKPRAAEAEARGSPGGAGRARRSGPRCAQRRGVRGGILPACLRPWRAARSGGPKRWRGYPATVSRRRMSGKREGRSAGLPLSSTGSLPSRSRAPKWRRRRAVRALRRHAPRMRTAARGGVRRAERREGNGPERPPAAGLEVCEGSR